MPEGPSIVILKELVQELHLDGTKVIAVSGNTSIDKERMVGQTLRAFASWGKHFLVCFGDFSLRVHFMLFGTYRINERKDTPARLSLQFEQAEINFYACSLAIIEGDLNEVYDWSADVMSPAWDEGAALEKLKARPSLLACDALLDQQIFSGSGNIIKNEVLYRTGIHPLSTMGAIPGDRLAEMVAQTRVYSFDFLRWKKEYTLKKHWLAHTRRSCKRCKLPLHKEYLGKTRRRSFFCTNCQQLYI
ncbi:DNA-formamidopyrimidine glycosylase family protein [Pedobacter faecalis]|uniref:DNA-formamidopyrimidine glycosylase family protein n=1 Tax=Pedobacter faecalis TaxID=3041495 RepID=UPI00254E6F32|nr:DNA-formamidopyrimidine glycosylase family protein [Pedobacter sp. ELA7]